MFLCDIFGSVREHQGKLTINDLLEIIPNGEILLEEDPAPLKQYENSVLLFMGAGDIQKFQKAYEDLLNEQ